MAVEGNPTLILQLSKEGKFVNRFLTPHKAPIESLCFSPSPDRIWSCSLDGFIVFYEIKRGVKTTNRLLKLQPKDSAQNLVNDSKPSRSLKETLDERSSAELSSFARSFKRASTYKPVTTVSKVNSSGDIIHQEDDPPRVADTQLSVNHSSPMMIRSSSEDLKSSYFSQSPVRSFSKELLPPTDFPISSSPLASSTITSRVIRNSVTISYNEEKKETGQID